MAVDLSHRIKFKSNQIQLRGYPAFPALSLVVRSNCTDINEKVEGNDELFLFCSINNNSNNNKVNTGNYSCSFDRRDYDGVHDVCATHVLGILHAAACRVVFGSSNIAMLGK
jgi:hypothetical protein